MRDSVFVSRAHPYGSVALDSPAGGENNGLTAAEREAIAQVVGTAARTAGDTLANQAKAPDASPARAAKSRRSPLLLVAVAVVVAVVVLKRK
jgi:hypothetical protein